MTSAEVEEAFARFVEDAEPRLLPALVGTFGSEVGGEATRDALAYAGVSDEEIETVAGTWVNQLGLRKPTRSCGANG